MGSNGLSLNKYETGERKINEIRNQHEQRVQIIVNMESTGGYHLPIYSALSRLFQVNIYQPRQIKEESKKNIRRCKTDKRDALTLSKIHLTHTPPATNYDDKEMADKIK